MLCWRPFLVLFASLSASWSLSACSPALDWRELRLQPTRWILLFPCKPQAQERPLELAGQAWVARLVACDAADLTFAALALSPRDSGDATGGSAEEARSALQALVRELPGRWGLSEGSAEPSAAMKLPPAVEGVWTRHRRVGPDGQSIMTQALSLADGAHLVQISIHGRVISDAAAETFFGQLRAQP